MNLSPNTFILLRAGFFHPLLDTASMKRSGSRTFCLSGAWELDTCLYLEYHKFTFAWKTAGTDCGEGGLHRAMPASAGKEPLPTLGFSLSSHLLLSLSQCTICSARLLSCDLSSASLLDPVYDKSSPSILTISWTVSWGMKKMVLYCFLLSYVHFII